MGTFNFDRVNRVFFLCKINWSILIENFVIISFVRDFYKNSKMERAKFKYPDISRLPYSFLKMVSDTLNRVSSQRLTRNFSSLLRLKPFLTKKKGNEGFVVHRGSRRIPYSNLLDLNSKFS